MNYFRPQTFNIVLKTFLVDHYEPSLTFIKLNLLHIFAPCGAFNRQLCLSGRYKFYAKLITLIMLQETGLFYAHKVSPDTRLFPK